MVRVFGETCVLNNVDDYIRQLLFSALRGPKMLYKTGNFLSALGLENPYAKHCCVSLAQFEIED